MPPPDAATGALSTRVCAFRLHPNVVRNFFVHHNRVKDSSFLSSEDVSRMSGCVIGMKSRRTVEIVDSLDLLLDPVSGTLCRALLEKKEHYKKRFPGSVVLGWYSSGTRSAAMQDIDIQIHKLMDAKGRAFYLLLDPAIKPPQMDLRVCIYDSVLCATDGSPQLNLVKFNCTIEAISTLGFIKVDNKSIAWDSVVGPGKDLENLIPKFNFIRPLIVPDAQLKYVFENKLKLICWLDARIVREMTWRLKYVLGEFVPEEKDNLTNEYHLPLSKELEKKVKACGFSVSPRTVDAPPLHLQSETYHYLLSIVGVAGVHLPGIDREFITTIGYMYILELTSDSLFVFLHHKFNDCFYGRHMSDLEFAKAIADRLHFSEEIIPNYGEYSKQDILRFTEIFLAAPDLKNDAMSHLKLMEAAASEDPLAVPDKKNSCLRKEEDDRPKKPGTRKRRAAESAFKMHASNKKAKVATPPSQKTGDNKGAVHVATLHPAKKMGKTLASRAGQKAWGSRLSRHSWVWLGLGPARRSNKPSASL
ncbi:unnamed protein product [Triticum turgidum subsp. durum]|uniref:JAB1/MPN/MOV34 metalloenzyme domain-containing protein n=1 Tax=Triticum turgidum subsp. durum TaxID=4567 RepID=A0A9R0RCT0_TRITD|nr:unnamed protein product [Triticum turgidum subsp. durum]